MKGRLCEIPFTLTTTTTPVATILVCPINLCANDGVCLIFNNKDKSCTCRSGFTGGNFLYSSSIRNLRFVFKERYVKSVWLLLHQQQQQQHH